MNYKSHIDNLSSEYVCSAQKAVDYMDGCYRDYLVDMLDGNTDYLQKALIKDWRKRNVQLVWENYVGMIIEKSAKTYQYQPERVVTVNGEENENATNEYNKILNDSNFRTVVEDTDHLSRLLTTAFILPQWVNEVDGFVFSSLSRNNLDVDYEPKTDGLNSFCFTAGAVGRRGGKLYHYWDLAHLIDFEYDSDKKVPVEVCKQDNIYKSLNLVPLFDVRKPRYGIWGKAKWEQLTFFNDGVNAFHIMSLFNAGFGSIGALFSNMTIPDDAVIGPDSVVQLDTDAGITPFLEYRKPEVDIEPFIKWLNDFKETIATQWGVNLSVAGSGTADSGFKLVVEEAPSLELRQKRINAAKEFERRLYTTVARIADKHMPGKLPLDGVVHADFEEPSLPVDRESEYARWERLIAMGLKDKRDFWKWENPDLTKEQLDEMELRYRTQATVQPNFDSV